jgi:hypothetical protein
MRVATSLAYGEREQYISQNIKAARYVMPKFSLRSRARNTGGSLSRGARTSGRRRRILLIIAGVVILLGGALIALLPPKKKIVIAGVPSYSASSSKNANSAADKAFDENPETAWIPGKQDPRYEWIQVNYSAPHTVSGMRMINGFGGERTRYRYGGKVRSARVLLSDYSSYYWMLREDSPEMQSISFERKHEVEWIRLFIHSIYKGVREPADEIGIAEIEFF